MPKEPSKIPISRQTINKMHWPRQTEGEIDRKREGECRQTRMLFGVAVCVAIIMRKLTMQLAL